LLCGHRRGFIGEKRALLFRDQYVLSVNLGTAEYRSVLTHDETKEAVTNTTATAIRRRLAFESIQ
jgi:hypothetical protein